MRNLKFLVLMFAIGTIWSCKTQNALIEAVPISKKVPLSDGRPSEADDQFEFDKSVYTHNGSVITDTAQIMTMLATARGLHIDETGYKKQILMTEEEVKNFEAATQNRTEAAPDGDNYLHYFYEVTRKFSDIYITRAYAYFSVVGPKQYFTQYAGIVVHKYASTSSSNPTYTGEVITDGLTPSSTINAYLVCAGSSVNFQINVFNTTRYKRRVKFISTDATPRTLLRDVNSQKSIVLVGSQNCSTNSPSFGGLTNFRIKRHESIKL